MKKHLIMTVFLLCLIILLSAVNLSLAWLGHNKTVNPALSFSAGGPDKYTLYKITCADDSSSHTVTEVDAVGTDGFSASDLQFGKINNLSTLEHSNYIYYAIRIPKDDKGIVSVGVYYDDVDSDGSHFKIYVPIKDGNGDIQYEDDGAISNVLFDDSAALENIKKIETDNQATFISYSLAISGTSPEDYESIETLESLFADKEIKSMNDFGSDPEEQEFDTSSLTGDFYYAYVKLVPNIDLYKYFIDYLWDNMPFFLAYEIRVTLEVI